MLADGLGERRRAAVRKGEIIYFFWVKFGGGAQKWSRQNIITMSCDKASSNKENMDRTGNESDLIAKSS